MNLGALLSFLRGVPVATYQGICDADIGAVEDLARRLYESPVRDQCVDAFEDLRADLLESLSTDPGRARLKSIANPSAYLAKAIIRRHRADDIHSRTSLCSIDDVRDEPIDVAAFDPERRLQEREDLDLTLEGIRKLTAVEHFVVLGLVSGITYEHMADELHAAHRLPTFGSRIARCSVQSEGETSAALVPDAQRVWV
jgi:hypothetical protein